MQPTFWHPVKVETSSRRWSDAIMCRIRVDEFFYEVVAYS